MKIIIVGDFYFDIYEKAIYDALLVLGYDVNKFSWHEYFKDIPYKKLIFQNGVLKYLYYKIQYKFAIGPTINKLNKDLLKFIYKNKPDAVLIYRGTHIYPKTIKKIKKIGSIIFGYNNDDPFSKDYPGYFWRHFLKGISFYDYIFAYRQKNIKDYKNIGYSKVSLLRSYYIKENNFYISNLLEKKYKNDVVFIGHFENDGRDEKIKYLLENNIEVKIFGGNSWKSSVNAGYFNKKEVLLGNLDSKEYNLNLNGAKISLVFLSKLNNDSYTRRCFEIPATKSLMLSEYSEDLNNMFEEEKEAAYFRSKEELLEKVKFYLANPEIRKNIAEAGYQRLLKDGHEVSDRVKEIIRVYNQIKNEKDSYN